MKKRTRKRYSTAFARKVVWEVETGKLSVQQARRPYDIGGGSTVLGADRPFTTGSIS
jgi:transposase-like protein